MGLRLRNAQYRDLADVNEVVAGRDLKTLSEAGLLDAVGERRARYYVPSERLSAINMAARSVRRPLEDPFQLVPETLTLNL